MLESVNGRMKIQFTFQIREYLNESKLIDKCLKLITHHNIIDVIIIPFDDTPTISERF